MDWRQNPQYLAKRNNYVKGIAESLKISEQDAVNLEGQIWNSAPSLREYPEMLKAKLEERKRMIAAAQQQQHMVASSQQQQQQQIIRVPISNYPVQPTPPGHMRPNNPMGMQQHQGQMRMAPGAGGVAGWGDTAGGGGGVGGHPASRMPMSSHVSTVVQPHAPQMMGGMQSQVVSGLSSSPMMSSAVVSGASVGGAPVNASQAGGGGATGIMMTSPSISTSSVIGAGGAPGHKMMAGAGGGGIDTMAGTASGMSGQHHMQTHAITSMHNSPMGAYMQPYGTPHPSAPNQQLTINGSNMNPGSANPNAPLGAMSATSPAVPLQSPGGGYAYSPHVVANPGSVNAMNNNMSSQQQSPAAPNSVEAVGSHPGGAGGSTGPHSAQQQQQTHQNVPSSTQQPTHVISEQMAEKIRQQILKFTTSVARSQAYFENNPNMWTPVIQKVYECGKGGASRVAQLSNAELELYNKEIKLFHTRYNKYKTPSAPEKIVRAISDIMPMPSLNYNLNKVFDEPKRIAKGSLITCPAKKQRTDIETYLVRDNHDDSFDQERKELKEQLQKEIAMSSEHFEIKFAMTTNYDSDPIVFNCFIKNERSVNQCGVVQITVYSDYPDSSVDVRLVERDSISKQEQKASKQHSVLSLLDDYNEILSSELRKRAQTFYSTLNSTQNCSFSHVLGKFVSFAKQTAETL